MKNINNCIKNINKKSDLLYIIGFLIYSAVTFELFNRPFGNVVNMKLPIDDMIPFVKGFIIPYHTFMPMVVIIGIMLLVRDRSLYMKYVKCLFFAQTSAYIIYVLFQTYVPRYDTSLLGDDLLSVIVKMTYKVDNSYNGAPSMHVCNSVIAAYFIAKSDYKNKLKLPIIFYMIFVAATTVFVKQHVFFDVPTGIIHAIISTLITSYIIKVRRNKL